MCRKERELGQKGGERKKERERELVGQRRSGKKGREAVRKERKGALVIDRRKLGWVGLGWWLGVWIDVAAKA
jgi:hypothetical protein